MPLETHNQIYVLEQRLEKLNRSLSGDASLARREFETAPSLNNRLFNIQGNVWSSTAAPSPAQKADYDIVSKQIGVVISELKAIHADMQKIESALEQAGAPYTPGRVLEWKN